MRKNETREIAHTSIDEKSVNALGLSITSSSITETTATLVKTNYFVFVQLSEGTMSSSSANASAASQEEKERRLAEERQALKLQRKQRLEALVRKRKANLQFLKVCRRPQ